MSRRKPQPSSHLLVLELLGYLLLILRFIGLNVATLLKSWSSGK